MNLNKNQIIYFGFLFHMLAAVFSIGYHHCDELFQVYEFAGYKLGQNNSASLPWEFHESMRSGIQPLIVYFFTRLFYLFSVANPFDVAMYIRIFQSIISFIAIVRLLNLFEKEIINEHTRKWLWLAGLLLWCLPYFHARFSSENFAVTLFIFGMTLILPQKNKTSFLPVFSAGLLFGLAFLARFQLLFMIAGLMAWLLFIQKLNYKIIFSAIAGIVFAIGAGAVIDYWLYDQWTLSWWNYLDLNLFKDKASAFGREPFYFYLEQSFLQLIPPFSLLFIFAIVMFWTRFRLHVITWITLPFVLIHFFVAHKELRFLFPVLNFLPFMLFFYFQSLLQTKNKLVHFLQKRWFIKFAFTVNLIALLAFTFKPADNISFSLKKIYDLTEGANPLLLYHGTNPYNNQAALNYFRKPTLKTINADSVYTVTSDTYYFSEKFNADNIVTINDHPFEKIYSNFPAWFAYLNFNGWLDRSFSFTVYKMKK